MKRMITLTLACLMGIFAVVGCGQKSAPNTIKDGKTLADVLTAVDAKFIETYGADYTAVAMPQPVDQQFLTDFCGIAAADVEEVSGNISLSMTNSDRLIAVKVKEGKADSVKASFEKYKSDLVSQYEMYNVSGSLDRAQAGEIYQKGDYVFFIMLGVMDMDSETQNFSDDVNMAKAAIDAMFNA